MKMLYLIGLGINDEKDITLRGLEILKEADEVYAELYTSIFSGNFHNLEIFTGKKITILSRSDLEENLENFLEKVENKNVALLVPGDPMVATTHISVVMKAHEFGIKTKVVHSSSIYSAIAETGLHIYKFGQTASIPYAEKSYSPETFYDILRENLKSGLHTLFLLDVKTEQKKFMMINEAIEILLDIDKKRGENIFKKETLCVGIARLGSDNPCIKFNTTENLLGEIFGETPHSLVVPGKLHFTEKEALERFI